MAITELSRTQLNQEFRDGERPSGDDFASAWLSFINKSDDGVKMDVKGNLELNAGIAIKNAADDSPAGTLRYNSGSAQLQYHNGSSFQNISTGAGGAFQVVDGGPSVAFGGGNVGVGTFATAPTHRLDVVLGNTSAADQVKLGNLAIHNGSAGDAAYISNAARTGDTEYALRQDGAGNTTINTANNTQLTVAQNGVSRFRILSSGAIELAPATNVTINSDTVIGNPINNRNLNVFGNINYTGTLTDTSDARLKKDVQPYKEGFEKLLALDPVSFHFNGKAGTSDDSRKRIGLIAQDVQQVLPEIIHPQSRKLNPEDKEETEILTIDSKSLTFVLINAFKEMAARLEKLEKKNTDAKRKSKSSA